LRGVEPRERSNSQPTNPNLALVHLSFRASAW